MTRQEILDKIAEFEAVLAKGEQAVAHIVQWAWSHLHAGGHTGSIVTGEVRSRISTLHGAAKNRLVAAAAAELVPPSGSTGTAPAPSQPTPTPSPDPNDKPLP